MTTYHLAQVSSAHFSDIICLALSLDGRFTACGSSSGRIAIHHNPSLKLVNDPLESALDSSSSVTAIAWSVREGVWNFKDSTRAKISEGKIHCFAMVGDLVAIGTGTQVTIMREVVDLHGTYLAPVTTLAFQYSHGIRPRPYPSTLHFKNPSILIVTYAEWGIATWDLRHKDHPTWLLLSLVPQAHQLKQNNSLGQHASLSPDGTAFVATRMAGGVSWFALVDRPLSAWNVRPRTTSWGRGDDFVFYIDDGNAVVLGGETGPLHIVSALFLEAPRILQVL